MAPKVHTPVKGYTGVVAGVAFADGVGETTDKNALAYFARHGYQVGGSSEGSGSSNSGPTKAQLVEEAKQLGLDTSGNKRDLEKRIADHKKQAENPPADGDTGANGENPAAPAGAAGEDVS